MTQATQLPHIISFLEDESPDIRKNSIEALSSFGSALRELLPVHVPCLKDRDYQSLYEKIRVHLSQKPSALPHSRFAVADKIEHKRYGYRGVIVDLDLYCMADDTWHQSNQTKPTKDQPWYHVLVNDSSAVTYAAESSLKECEQSSHISHPWVDSFFDINPEGSYLRNNTPWPRN